jgi:hypothetical protein
LLDRHFANDISKGRGGQQACHPGSHYDSMFRGNDVSTP